MATARIKSEITGTVWKVLLAEGDAIQVESELMILESMKMEIPVLATEDGSILAFKRFWSPQVMPSMKIRILRSSSSISRR